MPKKPLEGVLNALLQLCETLTDTHASGIFRIQGKGAPELLTTRNALPSFEARVHQLHKNGLLRETFEVEKPLVVSEADVHPEGTGKTLVVSPVVTEDHQVLGLFVIASDRAQDDYAEEELDLISILSRQAAMALENVRLYDAQIGTREKLKASQIQLVQSGKLAAVGQLAAGVAHEVNNPLQIILSRVQLLLIRHASEERFTDDLVLIESNVKRVSRIIRSLLDFARHNNEEEEWRSADLVYVVTQTANLMHHLMEKSGIEVQTHLPEGDSPKIHCNVGEIEQVFLNLFLNAHQAMLKGGKLDIELYSDGKKSTARIRDTGEGIPESHLPRIFDPFFTTREEQGGTGLGLSIIHGILKNHKGKITVDSQVGVGTTFTLEFPNYTSEAS